MTHQRKLTENEVLIVLNASQSCQKDYVNITRQDLTEITKRANKELM
jgi:hypothetical protein